MHLPRQDIDAAHHIPVRHKPTRRAAIHAPAGFVLVPTYWTGLRGKMLVYKLDGDALGLRLIGDVVAHFAVGPQANLLLTLGAHALAVGHVAHIAKRQRAGLALFRPVYHPPAHLVLNTAGTVLLLRQKAILARCQPRPSAPILPPACRP